MNCIINSLIDLTFLSFIAHKCFCDIFELVWIKLSVYTKYGNWKN